MPQKEFNILKIKMDFWHFLCSMTEGEYGEVLVFVGRRLVSYEGDVLDISKVLAVDPDFASSFYHNNYMSVTVLFNKLKKRGDYIPPLEPSALNMSVANYVFKKVGLLILNFFFLSENLEEFVTNIRSILRSDANCSEAAQ